MLPTRPFPPSPSVPHLPTHPQFYNNHADYVTAFPTGTTYGKTCATWIKAIRSAHPMVAVSVVATPAYQRGHNPRLVQWDQLMWPELKGILQQGDGATCHEYDATGAGAGKTFTQKDVDVMLGSPFAVQAALLVKAATLPSELSIWVR